MATSKTTAIRPVEVPVSPALRRVPLVSTRIEEDEVSAAVEVLRSGMLRQGARCAAFEQAYAAASDAEFALTTCNGTTALQMAYEVAFNPGDDVLCPGYTFMASASMILARGANPVFCDIDPATMNLDVADAAARITPKTTAIVPVHLYGNPVDIDAVEALAGKHNLKIVYDAAQSHFARYRDQGIGAYGDAVTYSFYPTKNMTTGEGGLVTTNDHALADRLALLRDHGMTPGRRYHHETIGYNYRLNDVAAAIGLVQLDKLPLRTTRRQLNAALLSERLGDIDELILPETTPNAEHVFHQYAIRLRLDRLTCTREEFAQALKDEFGVDSAIHYPTPLTTQPAIIERVANLPDLPVAAATAASVLCLPVHHNLDEADLSHVAASIRTLIARHLR